MSRVPVLGPRIAESGDRFTNSAPGAAPGAPCTRHEAPTIGPRALLLFFFGLLDLALLDDFRLGRRRHGRRGASAAGATSSTFGMITWTSIMSESLTGVHLTSVATSLTRTDCPTISPLTSTSM